MILTLMGDFEGFKTSVKEVPGGEMEIGREVGLEVEPEDETELLQSQIKFVQMRISFLWMSKENDLLRWKLLLVKML